MSATEMSTTETSAAKMSPTECQLIKILNLGYSLLKCLPMNSYYWACTKKCFTENCAIDLPATNMFTKRLKDLSLKCLPLKYPPLKCPPLNTVIRKDHWDKKNLQDMGPLSVNSIHIRGLLFEKNKIF